MRKYEYKEVIAKMRRLINLHETLKLTMFDETKKINDFYYSCYLFKYYYPANMIGISIIDAYKILLLTKSLQKVEDKYNLEAIEIFDAITDKYVKCV